MAAIITDQIRILNAKNFVAGVSTSTNSYYAFVGLATANAGIVTSFIGDFSWGRLQLTDRQIAQAYTANTNDGVTGIKTGPQIKRKIALKAQNYVV